MHFYTFKFRFFFSMLSVMLAPFHELSYLLGCTKLPVLPDVVEALVIFFVNFSQENFYGHLSLS